MSWNKNTIMKSILDQMAYILEPKMEVVVEVLGEVKGMGLNDQYLGIDFYPIRKLTCRDFVILEQMHRSDDCDFDDFINSYIFDVDKVPTNWPLELYDNAEEEHD